jgi:hypothetical protein
MTGTGPVGFGEALAQPAITIAAVMATQARIPFRMMIGRLTGADGSARLETRPEPVTRT